MSMQSRAGAIGKVPEPPRITTVMAAYNSADIIAAAIKSFASQSYPNKELIVVDGASTDGTQDIVEQYSDIISVFISEPDGGILEAWNKGISKASGDWIHFLGADDSYASNDVFERFAAELIANGQRSNIYYGIVARVDYDGDLVEPQGRPWNGREFRVVGMTLPHTGTMHHRSLFEDYGLFDTSYPNGYPYEFLLRYLKDHDAAFLPDLVVANMTIGGASNQPQYRILSVRADRRAQRLHKTARPSVSGTIGLMKAYTKYFMARLLPDRLNRHLLDLIRAFRFQRRMYSRKNEPPSGGRPN